MSGLAVSSFAAQFKRSGDGFIYRKNYRGAPIRVTAAERDAFVTQFRRSYFMLMAGMLVAVLVTLGSAIALGGLGNGADPVMVGVKTACPPARR